MAVQASLDSGDVFLKADSADIGRRRQNKAMKVIVQDNQIEKALRDLKKKLTKEGFFSEIKERRFYDKPSVQRKKKQAKAAKRRRKRMRRFS
jgi:small subunit ribosomal protein S21